MFWVLTKLSVVLWTKKHGLYKNFSLPLDDISAGNIFVYVNPETYKLLVAKSDFIIRHN